MITSRNSFSDNMLFLQMTYSTEDDSQETSAPIVTIDDKGQSISTAVASKQRVSGAVSPSTKEPSVAELTKALIHFIASK